MGESWMLYLMQFHSMRVKNHKFHLIIVGKNLLEKSLLEMKRNYDDRIRKGKGSEINIC